MNYRITSDIDFKSKFIGLYYFVKSFFIIDKITSAELRRSPRGNFHLIIFTNKYYSVKEIFNLRARLGDDKKRIRMDKFRIVGKNTLFYAKIPLNKLHKIEL